MQEGSKEGEKGKKGEGEEGEGKNGKKGEGEEGEGEGQGGEGEGQGEGGENGKDGRGNGEQNGEGSNGEGNSDEYQQGLLYEIYKEQQKLRQQLEDEIQKNGLSGNSEQLVKDMKDVEQQLLDKGFNNETLERMTQLKHELLFCCRKSKKIF